MMFWVGWIGIFLLTIGILAVLAGLRGSGVLARLRRVVIGLVLVAIGSLCLGLRLALRGCEEFSRETLIAEIVCAPASSGMFELRYAAVIDGKPNVPQVFTLRGDQWTISGGIVKWHPWLTALGVPSYHKPTRLNGRFALARQERASPPSLVELNGGEDVFWDWLYRLDPWLPFVEAAYGSAAFAPADPSRRFQVFVTSSGYLIKSVRP